MAFRFRLLCSALLGLSCLSAAVPAVADPAPFDLTGPTVEMTVTRAGVTLPISETPNLEPGDKLWIRADFPDSQSVHYLMVAAFLRGATNPPPERWFYRNEPWNRKEARGLHVTVPVGAEQLVVFLAPETGGDFKALVNAVQHRPGAFVRATQDLNHATLDRSRLDTYLAGVRETNATNPGDLKHAAQMMARSLAIKLDNTCFDRYSEQEAPCLMQNEDSLVLNDTQTANIAEELTSGPTADLAMEVSSTPQARYGYYSPYLASVLDIAHILESFHSAQYQYIPALAMPHNDKLSLRLNAPPSFSNPKSVIVVAMPAVEPPQPPPLHAVDATSTYCAENSDLVLPVEGAPLVFSTAYAHNMVLRLTTKDGKTVDLHAEANALKGGFVIDTDNLSAKQFGDTVSASLHGYWGFDRYDGPNFELENAHPQPWMLATADSDALIVGRDDVVHLDAGNAACVENIAIEDGRARELKVQWKQLKPTEVEVTLPLKKAHPGQVMLVVHQFGFAQPERVPLHSFAEAAHLNGFSLHAGDTEGVLTGKRLDEVQQMRVNGVTFAPGPLKSADGQDQLQMQAKDKTKCAQFEPGSAQAEVRLKDGRRLTVQAVIEQPRPQVALLSKSVQPLAANQSNINLEDQDELPENSSLTFSLHAVTPQSFGRTEAIEVSTAGHAFTTTLNMQNGGLTLQDEHTALATLDPAKAFGGSAFGPLQFRVVADGVPGSWQPLVTLVRLPTLKKLTCPAQGSQPCQLTGTELFLVDAVASDAAFQHAVQVPDGFPGYELPVPHPDPQTGTGDLYVKLRDDPTVVNQITLSAPPPPVVRPAAVPPPAPARAPYVPGEAAPTGAGSSNGSAAAPASSAAQPASQSGASAAENGPQTVTNSGAAQSSASPAASSTAEPATKTQPQATGQSAPQGQSSQGQTGQGQTGQGQTGAPAAQAPAPQATDNASSPAAAQPASGASQKKQSSNAPAKNNSSTASTPDGPPQV
ncbi:MULTISPECIES: hypothetical protein [Acidobacterium]|uniref:Putative lipoprotein n=1 Tax=Acidobacterium capsulatum (strain ATCC 51196 / DSM 11244 / BCRC 80197 / JCM 7670 / NBRC 15755 / NCIMB 13165 / 161) TaxID=240015 RepID=C1F839_ACIC5|nr:MULTISPECIES: hypothetical protein [Acidobacterium]ACO33194.1 putative lipoprotein [Acidobacterium capsulatum ATCC 51196]HCT59724.1 hypothetical protein [Acidobacterium sp.]